MKTNHTYLNSPCLGRWLFKLMPIVCLLIPSAHAATRTWDGGGTNDNWTTAANWVGDVVPVAGDDLVFPNFVPRRSSTNDFPADTSFSGLSISGPGYVLRGSKVTLTGGIVVSNMPGTITIELSILLSGSQTFVVNDFVSLLNLGAAGSGTVIDTAGGNLTFAGAGSQFVRAQIVGSGGLTKTGSGGVLLFSSNSFTGPVDLQQGLVSVYEEYSLGTTNSGTTISAGGRVDFAPSGLKTIAEPFVVAGVLGSSAGYTTNNGPIELIGNSAAIRVQAGAGLTVNSVISGSGGFTKTESGYLELRANNIYQGATILSNGTLRVNGSQPQSPVIIPGNLMSLNWLGGFGVVGNVAFSNSPSSRIVPGGFAGTIGILTVSNLTLAGAMTFGAELFDLAPGTGYDQLNVFGAVSLNNCALAISLGFPAALGTQFVIVNNDGNDAVQGTFSGKPQGAVFTASGALFQISYTGGDGNDVVLTRMDAPQKLAGISPITGGLMQIEGAGLSNVIYRIQAAADLTPSIQWSNVGTATGDLSGAFWFTDTNAPFFPQRYYRAVYP